MRVRRHAAAGASIVVLACCPARPGTVTERQASDMSVTPRLWPFKFVRARQTGCGPGNLRLRSEPQVARPQGKLRSWPCMACATAPGLLAEHSRIHRQEARDSDSGSDATVTGLRAEPLPVSCSAIFEYSATTLHRLRADRDGCCGPESGWHLSPHPGPCPCKNAIDVRCFKKKVT